MKVEYTKGMGKAKDAELYRVGVCLVIEEDGIIHRIALSAGQWKLLAEVAANVAQGL